MRYGTEILNNLWAYLLVLGPVALIVGGLAAAFPGLRARLLPLPRQRPGQWGGGEVFLVFVALILSPGVVLTVLIRSGALERFLPADAPADRQMLWATPAAVLLFAATTMSVLWILSRTRPRQYGLTWSRWRHNLVLAGIGFAVLTPAALGLHYLALQFVEPVDHFMEKLARSQPSPVDWAFMLFMAAVAAPVMEEILFRGVLLGWLRRASPAGHLIVAASALAFGADPFLTAAAGAEGARPLTDPVVWGPLAFGTVLAAAYGTTAMLVWRRETQGRESHPMQPWVSPGQLASRADLRLAIFGSAMLFAVVHSQAWPSPFALFVFGLVVGWLAQRTQSLLGPIILHALFNTVAFLVLYLYPPAA